jgi:hypothetical protein
MVAKVRTAPVGDPLARVASVSRPSICVRRKGEVDLGFELVLYSSASVLERYTNG